MPLCTGRCGDVPPSLRPNCGRQALPGPSSGTVRSSAFRRRLLPPKGGTTNSTTTLSREHTNGKSQQSATFIETPICRAMGMTVYISVTRIAQSEQVEGPVEPNDGRPISGMRPSRQRKAPASFPIFSQLRGCHAVGAGISGFFVPATRRSEDRPNICKQHRRAWAGSRPNGSHGWESAGRCLWLLPTQDVLRRN
jgi:hypothetical protein